jgi:hypothetical protein
MNAREHELLQESNRRLWDGDWRGAARLLLEAARLAESEGRANDAARGRQMAASLFRFAGDTDEALATAQALASTAVGDPARVAFAAAAERAEAFAAAGDALAAVPAYREALEHASTLSLPPAWRATVMRRLGEALARSGDSAAAFDTYAQARALHIEAGDAVGAAIVDLECAEALVAVHAWPLAKQAALAAIEAQGLCKDDAYSARVALVNARLAQHAGDLGAAIHFAGDARNLSLRAVQPVSYLASAAIASTLHATSGDRVAAYGVLATAWVTLGDLLGREMAASWVKPLLLDCAAKWGELAFAKAKAEYEAARRAQSDGS